MLPNIPINVDTWGLIWDVMHSLLLWLVSLLPWAAVVVDVLVVMKSSYCHANELDTSLLLW